MNGLLDSADLAIIAGHLLCSPSISVTICRHSTWEQYKNKVVEPFHIAGVDSPTDLFTKSLLVVKVEQFRSKIRLFQFSGSVETE